MSGDLQTVASIVAIIQGIAFVISVIFIAIQIRETNRLTRAAHTQALVELSTPLLLQLSQDPYLAELWVNGTEKYDSMNKVERFRYIRLLASWLMHHENAFYQYRSGWIDEKIYETWKVELQDFVQRMQLGLFWEKDFKRFFQTEFQQEVERLIQLS